MESSTAAIAIIASQSRYEPLIGELVTTWQVQPGDVTRLVLDDKKQTIGIAEVKEWLRKLYRTPSGEWRLAVITDAERLTPPSYNALLKTLEEPPSHTRIVLLLTKDTLLPTIRSRVTIRYDASPGPDVSPLLLPNSVSDIINTADDIAKKKSVTQFIATLLAAVRSDLRVGRISSVAAATIARQVRLHSSGMSAKVMVESVLLTYREARHDS